MTTSLKIALLLGVVTFATGTSLGLAQTARPGEGPMQGFDRTTERGADRLQREFDLNKDGRVTQDEMNRTLGARFRRRDWNGDGKLSLAEFAAPQRVRLVSMDRDGAGYVWCALRETDGNGRAGLSRFCTDNDLNMDGKLTRAELDASIAKRFAQATGGAQSMTPAQFAVSEQQRFSLANARMFRRLDADGDGLLTIREFADTELKLFAKLDKNGDRILAPTELRARYAKGGRGVRRTYN